MEIVQKNRTYEITETESVIKNIFSREDEKMIEHLLKKMLGLKDSDELPEGAKESPHRIAKYWTEQMAGGYLEDPKEHLKKTFAVDSDKKVEGEFGRGIIVSKFKLFSTCIHHLATWGTFREDAWAYVCYIPKDRVVGLSKIPRMARGYAKRLTLQEEVAENIANAMVDVLDPAGVMVVLKNMTHTCVAVRGAKSENATTTTSICRGIFETDSDARAEALQLCC